MHVVLLNRPAGKLDRLVQLIQASRNPVKVSLLSDAEPMTALKLSEGKLVREEQYPHAAPAYRQLDVSITGKLVKEEQ